MNLTEATQIADDVIGLLEPVCTRIVVAGSIRRGKPDGIHDIEIVCIPLLGQGGDLLALSDTNLLNERIEEMLAERTFHLHKDESGKTCNGDKHKKLNYGDALIDLYTAEPGNWGNILAIRTGNADFSHALVTPRSMQPFATDGKLMPGLKPSYLKQDGGYLWHAEERIECLEEEDFFKALGVPFVEPSKRNAETVRWVARALAYGKEVI